MIGVTGTADPLNSEKTKPHATVKPEATTTP